MLDLKKSIIIPAYNAEGTIQKTIESLKQQEGVDHYEIIVVDDGSTDQTADIVKSFPEVKYHYQENAGPAAARNYGAKSADGDILFFTDADCIPHQDWIKNCLPPFADNNIAVVCGSYGISNPEFLLATCIHKEILFRHKHLMPFYPRVFGSYNFAIRKKIFDEVGGFDVGYRHASGEDNDLSYKILKKGCKIYFEKNALVDHTHPTSILKYLMEQNRHGFWRARMYSAHPSMMKGDDYTFWKDVVEVLGVLFLFVLFLASFLTDVIPFVVLLITLFFLMEMVFGIILSGSLLKGAFFSLIMILRSFFRTFGFLLGIFSNFGSKADKKH